ncbi:DUF2975 domain-containing protein [Intrasporangium sp. DVR]|uniref:DUF2975 domain-containing protein n=1 Tax=Intrasporangium sp. DVR TaxID=3127867 RepID=UPI00313A601C
MSADRRDPLSFDSTDRKGLKGLLWAGALVVVGLDIVAPVLAGLAGEPIHAEISGRVTMAGLAPGVTVDNPASVLVAIADPTVAQRVLVSLPGALVAVAVVIVVRLLLGLLGDLRDEPFTPRNVRRLRSIAVVVGSTALVVPLVEAICDVTLADPEALGEGVRRVFELSVPLAFLALVLVIAAIAEAFRHGVALRADTDGLV